MKRLQCVFIGSKSKLYIDFLELLTKLNLNIQIKQAGLKDHHIAYSLKKCRDACLVVISDEVNYSLGNLSNLVWRYSPDAIIVIVTNKTITTSLKKPFNTTQIAKLFLEKESEESSLFLQYITQYAYLKADFRRCKRLLGVSEKRTQRMLDSSREAIAYTSRDMHLFANAAYLGLFEVDSIESLQRTPVQEFIKDDEVGLYGDFINQQLHNRKIESSLILSMRKANGLGFRASINAIPTVYKGKKCLQLWVRPINRSIQDSDEPIAEKTESTKLENKKPRKTVEKKEVKVDASSLLAEVLKRKEATISVKKLTVMQKNRGLKSSEHLMLALKIKSSHKRDINSLLSASESEHIVFWDKLKLTKLFQILANKKVNKKLYIGLSAISFNDKAFMEWMLKSIGELGSKKSSHLVFLMPYKLNKDLKKSSLKLLPRLKAAGCKIAFDDFNISTEHLMALKIFKPDYICLSPSWVGSIKDNESREVALGSLVRQFESKSIQVIAPCGLSKEMKRLFTLSGASFCLE